MSKEIKQTKQIIKKARGEKPCSFPPRPSRPIPSDYGEKPIIKPPKPTPPPPKK